MKPDGMLIDPEFIVKARQDVAEQGTGKSLEAFAKLEPAMAGYIYETTAGIAGKMALAVATTKVVQGSHEDMLAVILTCVQALRLGHYALWRDTVVGSRLAQLDTSLQASPRRQRKKDQDAESEN
jgi:hypothetical protein